jgi:hypothetical protein
MRSRRDSPKDRGCTETVATTGESRSRQKSWVCQASALSLPEDRELLLGGVQGDSSGSDSVPYESFLCVRPRREAWGAMHAGLLVPNACADN